MLGYWLSFGLIAAFILIGFPLGLRFSKRFVKIKITPDMNKGAKETLIKSMALYLLADLFYMAHFINNLLCKFIFGGLMLLLIYVNLGYSFSSPSKKNRLTRFGLIQDFLIGIGLTIYLIYLIPNKELQSVVIPIIAAVYGGLITLTGVAWTIRKTQFDKNNEEKEKAKPLFTFNMFHNVPSGEMLRKICVPEDLEIDYQNEVYVELENSEKSTVAFKRLYHDGIWFELQANKTMLPNKTCILSFRYNSPLNIFIEVSDIYGINYYYHLHVYIEGKMLASKKSFGSIREMNEISFDELNLLINPPKKGK